MSVIVGNYYENIILESFYDKSTSKIRVRPVTNQILPSNLMVECSRAIRKAYPIGTKFISETIKVCSKANGMIYLRAKDQFIKVLK